MDRIQDIRLFIRVVDLGSFSKAANEAGIGQPAVTKQINRMERQLGVRLLHRTTHGVSPTEIGLIYYDKCKLICHHVAEAESVGTLLQTQIHGTIRVSSSVAFGRRVMTPLVLDFMKANPQVRIELNCDDRYVNLVEQGMDLAIRLGKLADSTLGATYLGENPWVLVASPAYLKTRGKPAKPSDLNKHDALIYSSVQGDHRWQFISHDSKMLSIPVKAKLVSNNLSLLLAAARSGFGIAALPCYVAHRSIQDQAVISLLGEWQIPTQQVHAVYPSPRLVPVKVKKLIHWLQGQFGPEWWKSFSN